MHDVINALSESPGCFAVSARGPLTTLTTRLKAAGLMTEDDFQRLQHEADAEVQAAVQSAGDAAWEPIEELTRHVYAEKVTP